ncbi:MAG: hypothetical protein PHF18_02860 [Methanosarcina sp.]|nr:hypothetical protein [Methanosarcina sp.]MDD3245794.1 hypothetical protein [Methanosarcina sp.]
MNSQKITTIGAKCRLKEGLKEVSVAGFVFIWCQLTFLVGFN